MAAAVGATSMNLILSELILLFCRQNSPETFFIDKIVYLMENFIHSSKIAIYGFIHLPSNFKSFEPKPDSYRQEVLYIPIIAICAMRFFTAITLMVREKFRSNIWF